MQRMPLMQPSNDCYKLTMNSEGCKLKAYQDTGGVWTIGYGHTMGVRSGQTITLPLAVTLLKHDMEFASNFVNAHALPCTQGQFDALTDFVFNCGPDQFLTSHLIRYHKAGEYDKAAAEFPKWKYDNGQVIPGLVTRRAAEKSLYSHQGLPTTHQQIVLPEHSESSTVCFGVEDLGPEPSQFLKALTGQVSSTDLESDNILAELVSQAWGSGHTLITRGPLEED